MQPRHISPVGLATLCKLECYMPHVYDDALPYPQPPWDGHSAPRGHLTVGYGHCLTAGDIISHRFADGISRDGAAALLGADLTPREQMVCAKIHPEIGVHQFDALVCFVFNWGHVPPEIATAINCDDTSSATLRPLWLANDKGNGIPHLLATRRAREWALWIEPDQGPDGPGLDAVMASVDATSQAIEAEALADHVHGPETAA
jgi:GH24 family phage-related lysozyme (muramidase)